MDGNSFIRNRGSQIETLGVDVRVGKAQVAISCVSCEGLKQSGFYVVIKDKVLLLCMGCMCNAIMKYQKINPEEKLLDVDINANEAEYRRAADAVRKIMPELSESKADELAHAAINAI